MVYDDCQTYWTNKNVWNFSTVVLSKYTLPHHFHFYHKHYQYTFEDLTRIHLLLQKQYKSRLTHLHTYIDNKSTLWNSSYT